MFNSRAAQMIDDDTAAPAGPIAAAIARLRKPAALQATEIKLLGLRRRLSEAKNEFRQTCISENSAGASTESQRLRDQRGGMEAIEKSINTALVELGAARSRFQPAFRAVVDPLALTCAANLTARAEVMAADVADLAACQEYAAQNGLTMPLATEHAANIGYALQMLVIALRGARPQ